MGVSNGAGDSVRSLVGFILGLIPAADTALALLTVRG